MYAAGRSAPGSADATYYQRGLRAAMEGALEAHAHVLLPGELDAAERILRLPEDAQRLFFRLQLRRRAWLRLSADVSYAEIQGIGAAAALLGECGLAHTGRCACACDAAREAADGRAWTRVLLESLRVQELRAVCREVGVRAAAGAGRADLLSALLSPRAPDQKALSFFKRVPEQPIGSDSAECKPQDAPSMTRTHESTPSAQLSSANVDDAPSLLRRTRRSKQADTRACELDSAKTGAASTAATAVASEPADNAAGGSALSDREQKGAAGKGSEQPKLPQNSAMEEKRLGRIAAAAGQAAGAVVSQCGVARALVSRLAALHMLTFDVLDGDGDASGTAPGADVGAAVLAEVSGAVFAPYTVLRTRPIFADRAALDAYEAAAARLAAVERGPAGDFSSDVARWRGLVAAASGPYFLRRYAPAWVYARVLEAHVGALERARRWAPACGVLRALLAQDAVCVRHRAVWWERLVVDAAVHRGELTLDGAVVLGDLESGQHERLDSPSDDRTVDSDAPSMLQHGNASIVSPQSDGKPDQRPPAWDDADDFADALGDDSRFKVAGITGAESASLVQRAREHARSILGEALRDPHVKGGRRHALVLRLRRLDDGRADADVSGVETHVVYADAVRLPGGGAGRLAYWCPAAGGACGVEALVLGRWCAAGWAGVHAEGALWSTLLGVLLWDALFFADVPDAFHGRRQDGPLDMRTAGFYASRRDAIDARLAEVAAADALRLGDMVAECHAAYVGVRAAGVRWASVPLAALLALAAGLGGARVAAVLRLLVTEYDGGPPSGVPDLFVYRDAPASGGCGGVEVAFVEVKSTRDRLSDRQRYWLSLLVSLGVRCVVCRVLES